MLPLRYTVIGRIIPERAYVNAQNLPRLRFEAGDLVGEADIMLRYSNFHVAIFSNCEPQSTETLANIAQQLVAPIVDFIGFKLCATYRIVVDHVVNHFEQNSSLVSVIEPVFYLNASPQFTFRPNEEFEAIDFAPFLATQHSMRSVLDELSTALKRPAHTPMHCYIAIEYIREMYGGKHVRNSWTAMRERLSVSIGALNSVKDLATDQKHGKIGFVSWEQRKRCLQITWELVHRQMALLLGFSNPFPEIV